MPELKKLKCKGCGDSFMGNPDEEKECLRCGESLEEVEE